MLPVHIAAVGAVLLIIGSTGMLYYSAEKQPRKYQVGRTLICIGTAIMSAAAWLGNNQFIAWSQVIAFAGMLGGTLREWRKSTEWLALLAAAFSVYYMIQIRGATTSALASVITFSLLGLGLFYSSTNWLRVAALAMICGSSFEAAVQWNKGIVPHLPLLWLAVNSAWLLLPPWVAGMLKAKYSPSRA